MALSFELQAEFRDDQGKGASRRLRRHGKVPAILYGGGEEPRALSLDHTDLMHHLEHEAFYSHILTIKVGDLEQQAILKDLQRHPARRQVMHADFQRVVAGQEIRMNVPLHFLGEDVAPGRKQGGVFTHMANEVEIACLPRHLPEFLELDASAMELDQVLTLSDVKLPEGVEILELTAGHDLPLVSLARPRIEVEPEEEVEGAEEGVAPEAGEEQPEEPPSDED